MLVFTEEKSGYIVGKPKGNHAFTTQKMVFPAKTFPANPLTGSGDP
jgi:hypothetical protein